jgi:hypothetical protein
MCKTICLQYACCKWRRWGAAGSGGAGKRRIGADAKSGNQFHIKIAVQKKHNGLDERGPLACALLPAHTGYEIGRKY